MDVLDKDVRWEVDSPAIGADLQARPCGNALRAAEPRTTPNPVALTLSGGGFRATLAGLGVLRLLADAGLLRELRYVSSVSGGSIANGVLATKWAQLRDQGYDTAAVDRHVIDPLVQRISRHSLKFSLLRGIWRTIGSTNRTELLARRFDEWFFDGIELERLDPEVRWIINAANLVTGVRFAFERDVVGDFTTGLASTSHTGLRLSTAVAASAAVPGGFAPLTLGGISYPCGTHPPVLLDGGTYDNTGIQALDSQRHRHAFLVSLNAGGLLRPAAYGKVPIIRDLARANSLLYRQSTALRTKDIVNQFKQAAKAGDGALPEGARRGVLFGLATSLPDPAPETLQQWRARFPEVRSYRGAHLALVPTVFDKLDRGLCRALVYRGWWLAGATLATYHPQRLGEFAAFSPPEL